MNINQNIEKRDYYKVTIPNHVNPGEKFIALIGGKIYDLICPLTTITNKIIYISIPSSSSSNQLKPPPILNPNIPLGIGTLLSSNEVIEMKKKQEVLEKQKAQNLIINPTARVVASNIPPGMRFPRGPPSYSYSIPIHMQKIATTTTTTTTTVPTTTITGIGINYIRNQPQDVIMLEPEDFFEASEEHSFQNYTPVHYHEGQPHPDQLVQSASLSAVDPPPIEYELSLPNKVKFIFIHYILIT